MRSPDNPRRWRSVQAAGFTLIEVLLVIVIIGMLAAVVVVTIGGQQEGAAIDTTKLKIQKLESQLAAYNLNIGHYPTEQEGGLEALIKKPTFENDQKGEKWRGPYAADEDLNDAWGNKINYEAVQAGAEVSGGKKFKIWSNGPDQQSNTDDDIKNWSDESRA